MHSSKALDPILDYHEGSKHSFARYAPGPRGLDWATQPHPFRRWLGAELRPLELIPVDDSPQYAQALAGTTTPAPLSRRSLSQLLQDSFGLSAWKQAGASRWALRVNPSSGNLHPTEAYLLAPAVAGVGACAAVYHYAPHEHGLEHRAAIPEPLWAQLDQGMPVGTLFVGLSSIHWREAWKYGERAFRYCQHDVGHAIAALSLAASGLGWRVAMIDAPATSEIAALLGLSAERGPEAEHADCLLLVQPTGRNETRPQLTAELARDFRRLDWQGEANQLSPAHQEWPAIDRVAAATAKPRSSPRSDLPRPPRPARAEPDTRELLRPLLHQRRSGVAFDGRTGMSTAAFHRLLRGVMPTLESVPFAALPWRARVDLALFVHRVEGYRPGLYWLQRDAERGEGLRKILDPSHEWSRPPACPAGLPLYLLREGDVRNAARSISCQQDIAADGAFSLGMIADFAPALREWGPWFYPRLFWECGAIGQRLYVESEAVGLRSTGIGCFLDDSMHEILGCTDHDLQSLYHFTLGRAVEDPRIATLPAYAHLQRLRS